MAELRIVIPDDVDRYLDMVIKSGMFGNKAELARAAIVQFLNTIGPISKGYDKDNFFSPDGRIFQLEYAREAVRRGGTVLGICCSDGIFIASEDVKEKFGTPLMMSPMKIHKVSEDVLIGTSGLVMDGFMILEQLRGKEFNNAEELITTIREIYWSHTIKKDVRPLGIGLLVGTTFDRPQLFEVDASGAVSEYSAVAIGAGKEDAMKKLAEKYKHMTIKEAGKLIPAILGKDKEFLVETLYFEA